MKRLLFLSLLLAGGMVFSENDPASGANAVEGVPPAIGSPFTAEQQMIYDLWLVPHHSKLSPQMITSMRDWYGIPPIITLTILGKETGMGDTVKGGRLVGVNNFGCMRYGTTTTKWGSLADGKIWVGGKDWFTFPTAWVGMQAWGRYIKTGTRLHPNVYQPILLQGEPDWDEFTSIYAEGAEWYSTEIKQIYKRIRELAAEHGFDW